MLPWILLQETITVKLNPTGDASRWRVLKQSWMPLGCGNDFDSIVLKNLLTMGIFLITVELPNMS